jgi:hypothetical protein
MQQYCRILLQAITREAFPFLVANIYVNFKKHEMTKSRTNTITIIISLHMISSSMIMLVGTPW